MYAPVLYLLNSTFKPTWLPSVLGPSTAGAAPVMNFPACGGRGRGGE
jgi:hypothetical protein